MEEELERDMKPKLIGDTYMKYATEKSRQRNRFGMYECPYCGKEFESGVNNIKRGNTKSCGCKVSTAPNRFYNIWNAMIQRCTNPLVKRYKDYGARGIIVCEEWLDVIAFTSWAESTHPNVDGYSLDRIDNDKGYSPENCRWADKTTQCVNQRIRRDNTSGFVGIFWHKIVCRWYAQLSINNKKINIGSYKTIEEAVQARDNYIIENNLPHKLSTDYGKEAK